jgi:hypothetical protein
MLVTIIAALLLVSSHHVVISFSPTFEPQALSITIGLNAAIKQRFASVEQPQSNIKRRRSISNLSGRASSSTPSTSAINLIKGEAYGSEPFDENEGGVGLAKRSAIKISGVVTSGDGSSSSSGNSNCEAQELVRYSRLHELNNDATTAIIKSKNCQLLYTGKGIELYQDPGKSYRIEEKVIQLAPIMAVRDALASSSSSAASSSSDEIDDNDYDELVINFLGGDELIIGEVMEACNILVNELLDESILRKNTKKNVKFNSISYTQIPADVCYVTVIAVGHGGRKSGDGLDGGVDESIAKGEIYIKDGKWWTVTEEDIVTN